MKNQPLSAGHFYYPVKVDAIDERLLRGSMITAESIAWAEGLGLLSSDEEVVAHFVAASSGTFATLGFPNATAEQLRIISDTNCAVFITDDACDGDAPHVIRTDRRSVDDIQTTVSMFHQPSAGALPFDMLPLRTAMSDLGERLARAGASLRFLRRFAESLKGWLTAVRREDDWKSGGQVPEPSSLMALRPDSGAVYVFMHFIELANGIYLPDDTPASEPIKRLRQIASRLILYPHDIFSARKEIEHGHPMNLVMSLMHHRGMKLETAVTHVVRAHNDEMRTFDDLAKAVIRSEPQESPIRAYVLGLRHYIHGLFAWQWNAKRYTKDFIIDIEPGVTDSPYP